MCRFNTAFLVEIQDHSSAELILNVLQCQQIWGAQTVVKYHHRDKDRKQRPQIY